MQPAARADNGPPASSAALLDHGTSSEENAISDATASSAARYRDSIVDEYSAPDTVTETTETSRWDERRGEGNRRISEASWQTWGPGARFACVPTVSGNAWFAAVTAPESCVDPLRKSASPSLPHCQWGALSNGSRPATAEEVADLRQRYCDDCAAPLYDLESLWTSEPSCWFEIGLTMKLPVSQGCSCVPFLKALYPICLNIYFCC